MKILRNKITKKNSLEVIKKQFNLLFILRYYNNIKI